jgi:uncharacterized protein (DUF58 family)
MISQELLSKIRSIEIHTRRLLSGMHVGDYTTALKGSGFEFDQIREYQAGDDVRFIDWNSSVRMNKMLVRQYLEERNRTILLLVDTSPSTKFGSTELLKSECMAQIASVLALVADYGKDAVGLVQYSEKLEQYLPPARGRKHVHALMEKLFEQASDITAGNNTLQPLAYHDIAQLLNTKHKNAIIFVISDFIDTEQSIEILGRASKHAEIVAIRCLDAVERSFPAVGILAMSSPRDNELHFFDMSTKSNNAYNKILEERLAQQNKQFKKYKIDCLDVSPGTSFMQDLINFSKRRMRY